MTYVTIRRCPVCADIGHHAVELVAELRDDRDLTVRVTDGSKGEFAAEVDGRRIDGWEGGEFRSTEDIASEVRGAALVTA